MAVLDALGGRSRFGFVYAGGDGLLKPRPDPVVAVERAFEGDVERVGVVGDAEQDIRAARAAGATAVAVRCVSEQPALVYTAGTCKEVHG